VTRTGDSGAAARTRKLARLGAPRLAADLRGGIRLGVTYPSHLSESPIRVTYPSHLSESLIRVTYPSHISESPIRVTCPSHLSESPIRGRGAAAACLTRPAYESVASVRWRAGGRRRRCGRVTGPGRREAPPARRCPYQSRRRRRRHGTAASRPAGPNRVGPCATGPRWSAGGAVRASAAGAAAAASFAAYQRELGPRRKEGRRLS
jgi:hypothetical protein